MTNTKTEQKHLLDILSKAMEQAPEESDDQTKRIKIEFPDGGVLFVCNQKKSIKFVMKRIRKIYNDSKFNKIEYQKQFKSEIEQKEWYRQLILPVIHAAQKKVRRALRSKTPLLLWSGTVTTAGMEKQMLAAQWVLDRSFWERKTRGDK